MAAYREGTCMNLWQQMSILLGRAMFDRVAYKELA